MKHVHQDLLKELCNLPRNLFSAVGACTMHYLCLECLTHPFFKFSLYEEYFFQSKLCRWLANYWSAGKNGMTVQCHHLWLIINKPGPLTSIEILPRIIKFNHCHLHGKFLSEWKFSVGVGTSLSDVYEHRVAWLASYLSRYFLLRSTESHVHKLLKKWCLQFFVCRWLWCLIAAQTRASHRKAATALSK